MQSELDSSLKPNVGLLQKELKRIQCGGVSRSHISDRITRANNIRYCKWKPQSPSGLKEYNGARPWKFARDARVRLVDSYCKYVSAILEQSDVASFVQVRGIGDSDLSVSAVVRKYIQWLLNSRIKKNLQKEISLLISYEVTYGWAAAYVCWEKKYKNKEVDININVVNMLLQQAGINTPFHMLDDNNLNSLFEEFLGEYDITRNQFQKLIENLRAEGHAKLKIPQLIKSIPCVKALMPYREVVVSNEYSSPSDSRVVFVIERMTEHELKEYQYTRGWNKRFVDQTILSNRGVSSENESRYDQSSFESDSIFNTSQNDDKFEIVTAYRKSSGKDGIPVILQTVFSNFQSELYAEHTELSEANGEFPFVFITYECDNPSVYSSRGIPFILKDHQQRMKALIDMTYDAVGLQTLPPLVCSRNFGENISVSPGRLIRFTNQSSAQFLETKSKPELNIQMQDALEKECDTIIGRGNESISPEETLAIQEYHRWNYLRFKGNLIELIWRMCQIFESDDVFARVTESSMPMPRDTDFDIALSFDARLQNLDFAEKIVEKMILLSQNDNLGVFDRSKLMEMAATSLSPLISSEVISKPQEANQKIYNEVMEDVIKISEGNPPTLRTENQLQDAQIRLNALQDIYNKNPIYQSRIKNKERPFLDNIQKYAENLQFAMQQRQNAITGRLGVKPNQ